MYCSGYLRHVTENTMRKPIRLRHYVQLPDNNKSQIDIQNIRVTCSQSIFQLFDSVFQDSFVSFYAERTTASEHVI